MQTSTLYEYPAKQLLPSLLCTTDKKYAIKIKKKNKRKAQIPNYLIKVIFTVAKL